jgi:hypothetical protein
MDMIEDAPKTPAVKFNLAKGNIFIDTHHQIEDKETLVKVSAEEENSKTRMCLCWFIDNTEIDSISKIHKHIKTTLPQQVGYWETGEVLYPETIEITWN